jgi:hypothetical protein
MRSRVSRAGAVIIRPSTVREIEMAADIIVRRRDLRATGLEEGPELKGEIRYARPRTAMARKTLMERACSHGSCRCRSKSGDTPWQRRAGLYALGAERRRCEP